MSTRYWRGGALWEIQPDGTRKIIRAQAPVRIIKRLSGSGFWAMNNATKFTRFVPTIAAGSDWAATL